jgi:hypothetical protein
MTMLKLTCPHCAWDASADGAHYSCFRYLEEVTSTRRVIGMKNRHALAVEAGEKIGVDDEGSYPRLLCGNCLEEFPVPDGITIEIT